MFTLKCCPLTPMTEEEMRRQIEIVSAAAEAFEFITEQDEIEFSVRIPRRKHGERDSSHDQHDR